MSNSPLSVLSGVRGLHTWEEVMEAFPPPFFRWEEQACEEGGRYASAVLSGSRETGERWELVVMENCSVPEHVHILSERYAELVFVLEGELTDITDAGRVVILQKGSVLVHNNFRSHGPNARFVVMLVHQPRGCHLTKDLSREVLEALESGG